MKTAEDIIEAKGGNVVSVTPTTTIHAALKVMVENKIGAVLIVDEERIAGIWTERDLMRNTLTEWFNPKVAQIKNYMVSDVQFASHDDSIYDLMDKFLGLRLRHLPIERDGEFIGLLSIGDVLKACLHEKTLEFEKIYGMVSWDYYEEWKWELDPEERKEVVGG